MTTSELIENIFTHNSCFEKEVLGVDNEKERSDIMHILSDRIVRNILKDHISFLHIKKISDFTLKHVSNILFKELANEWIAFAVDLLDYTKEEALAVLQKKDRVKYLHDISDKYYKIYKDYFYEDIANTFIDLLASLNQSSTKVVLVNAAINSELIPNRSMLGINSFDQLYRRIISAKNLKNAEVSALQIKLSDILLKLDSNTISDEKRDELLISLSKYEKKNEKMSVARLEDFDDSLKRVKMAIINSLKKGVYKL